MNKLKVYVRVKLKLPEGGTKIIWAEKRTAGKYVVFERLDTEGNRLNTRHIFIAADLDIIWEKPARMNNKYALLEVVQ